MRGHRALGSVRGDRRDNSWPAAEACLSKLWIRLAIRARAMGTEVYDLLFCVCFHVFSKLDVMVVSPEGRL